MSDQQPFIELFGSRVSLTATFKIGRSSTCALTLDDSQASREHAMIALDQGRGAWLLMDLGSTNGTRLNGLMIARATLLRSGDRIGIGSHELTFYDAHPTERSPPTVSTRATAIDVRKVSRWLLLGDVCNSTRLWQEKPEDIGLLLRSWVGECARLIETSGGWINEYLGDGFLAAWKPDEVEPAEVAVVLRALVHRRPRSGLRCRFVLHKADVQSGAAVSSGLEKLAGTELNFLFKAEKVVSGWSEPLVVTEHAGTLLRPHLEMRPAGEISVPGFDETRMVFVPLQ